MLNLKSLYKVEEGEDGPEEADGQRQHHHGHGQGNIMKVLTLPLHTNTTPSHIMQNLPPPTIIIHIESKI